MKKLFYTAILLFVLLFSSCQEEKQTYSCDPTIDQWVKNNLDEIQSMTRATWKTLPENFKGATFGAFTPPTENHILEGKIECNLRVRLEYKRTRTYTKITFYGSREPFVV
ncbi:hypothetical protein [Bacteroides congonensis]